MIEVRVLETGDTAYAESPDDALYAARYIGREARDHRGIQGFDPTLVFVVADEIVRSASLRSLDR